MSDLRHVYLVDGSGFIFRAFHGLPAMTNPDGVPVNAVYGFTTMLLKLIGESDADHVAVVFDTSRHSFRTELYPEYKAHRPPPPEDLVPQFPLIRDAVRAFNLPAVEMAGFEADDLIATYAIQARAAGAKVTIVSSDKDLMQLVGDGISMLDPLKNRTIGPAEVMEKFGVPPEKVVDVQALCGDATDNVPGVPGIGIKTAAQLITEYGDLDQLLDKAGGIKQPKRRETLVNNRDKALISRDLVRLRQDVPVSETLEDFRLKPSDPQQVGDFLRAMGFKSLLNRLGGKAAARPASQNEPAPTSESVATTSIAAASAPTETHYELVTELAALDRWMDQARQAGFVAIDTETTGLNALQCALVGVSLSVAPGRACYIPVKHGTGPAQGSLLLDGPVSHGPALIPLEQVVERLRVLGADASVLKIGHNLKYDGHVLGRLGVELAPLDDTMLLSYVLDGSRHGHGMDELAALHLGHQTIKFSDVCGSGKNQITFDQVPLEQALAYAAEDADITLRLHGFLKARLLAERMVAVYETLERPLLPVVAAMERQGIKVDCEVLRGLSEDFGQRMDLLQAECHQLAGHEFNVASPQQLGKVLFEEMGLSGGKKTKTGQWATGADVLEDLAAQGHALPARLLDHRQLAKLKSTYTDALMAQINPQTGRVHTNYSLAATSTGRLSSSDPNLQNIPIRTEDGRKIRHAFVAEPGFTILSADYSQIELRLIAHVANIPALQQAFHEDLDIHAMTAAHVFGVPVEGMDPMLRRRAKAINFGIIYGISAFGLAAQLGISNGEAKGYIDAYFRRFPEIRTYMDETKEQARQQGYVSTLFGRKIPIPGIGEKSAAMRAFAERAAINAPIQGGAADIIKRAMIRLPAALDEAKLSARLLLQVHDELVFEVRNEELAGTIPVVKRIMEQAAILSVPLIAETGSGPSWGAAH